MQLRGGEVYRTGVGKTKAFIAIAKQFYLLAGSRSVVMRKRRRRV